MVVVPVAALCTVLTAAWPAARRRLGIVTPIIALGAFISVPITTEAGQWLQARVGHTELAAAAATLAVGSVMTVVQIGESGAHAIWTGSFTQNPK